MFLFEFPPWKFLGLGNEPRFREVMLRNDNQHELEPSALLPMEEALRDSEEKFRSVFRDACVGMVIVSLEGRFLAVNAAFCDFLGYSEQELLGKDFQAVTYPEDLPKSMEKLNHALAGRGNFPRLEKRYLRKDGIIRWAEVSASLVRSARGEPQNFVTYVLDITDRKQTEAAFRASEIAKGAILESLKSPLAVVRPTGEIAMVNTAWDQFGRDNGAGGEQKTGIGANYLAECKRASAAGSLAAEKAYIGIRDVLARRLESFELEYLCDCPTAKHWFQMTAVPLETPEGGAVMIHRDVTALKEAEMAARESESRFRHVADNAPVMIWMSGLDKLCTYFNRTWLDFTGQPLDIEIGNGWTRGVHSEDLKRCMGTYTSAFERRQPFQMEYRLRRHDGEYRWLFDTGVPRFHSDGSFAGYIGSCVDVSDRKQAEEAMASVSGRLIEAQEKERSRIARELHDDVSQRLAVLSWSLHELQKELPPDAPAGLSQKLAGTLNKASEISNDVRVLSHHLHSSQLDMMGLAAAMESFCQEFAEQQKVEIDFTHGDIPQDLPRDVSLCLFRILQEGLHNAVKYSGVQRFEARLQPVSGGIQLVIRDSGMGFDVQAAMKEQGIGLISMRERVSLVKGTLSIVSKPLKGTEIKVRVPSKP